MAFGRRNFASYRRGDPSIKGDRALAEYRNKTIVFLVATAAYTAFLYSSGTDTTSRGCCYWLLVVAASYYDIGRRASSALVQPNTDTHH
jgi:thiaminase